MRPEHTLSEVIYRHLIWFQVIYVGIEQKCRNGNCYLWSQFVVGCACLKLSNEMIKIAWLSLCFILETSWVALFSLCEWVCQASVSPDQISTFSNIYRHTSPLLTMYHLISSSTNLYWPSTSQYRHILTQYHQVPLIIHHLVRHSSVNWIISLFTTHLMSHAQYTWSSSGSLFLHLQCGLFNFSIGLQWNGLRKFWPPEKFSRKVMTVLC